MRVEQITQVLAQMPPDQRKVVLAAVVFAVFFVLSLFTGIFGAVVWMSLMSLAMWFADDTYHWSERVFSSVKEKV